MTALAPVRRLVRSALRRFGLDIVRYPTRTLPDLPEDENRIVSHVGPYTATSPERIAALVSAVKYISKHRIAGDIVECGVFRGGSMMAAALALKAQGDTTRELYLYDTYEGMPPPTARDVTVDGSPARSLLARTPRGTGLWCAAGLEEVKENLYSTDYPRDRIHFVRGRVEETIPATIPRHISILRLDTDWYESTKHELNHLYPLVDSSGVVLIDDYGHWKGARLAVDEFLATLGERVFLHRIDYTGRIIVRGGS